jgi:predicted permease
MPDPTKLYRWLLKVYPARFREEYEAPMERQFRDEYREARGFVDRLRLWQRVVLDVTTAAPREGARELMQDLSYSFRLYRARSVSAVFAVAALGLAIGTSTAIFSVLNALLLRSLPFSDPARLVELRGSPVGAANGRAAFAEWSRRNRYLDAAAAFSISEMNLKGKRDALRVKVAETSANFFQLLGTDAVVGRTFTGDEDKPGQTSVAVISHNLWRQWFGGVHDVAGSSLQLNGAVFTVIGVAPPGFDYPGNTGVWVPTVFDFETVPRRGAFLFQTIGRLKPDVSQSQAQSFFHAEVQQPGSKGASSLEGNGAAIVSLREQLAGSVREAGLILAGLILLVLLVACANVAQLLLSRATERRQEMAVRAALGASRARLFQQLITEATVLTAAGAALGLLVAHWAVQIAMAVVPAQLATQTYTILDLRVVGFAAALALSTGIIFGILPASLVGRPGTSERTMRTKTGSPDKRTKRTRAWLAALQAGLTLVLVTSSVAMGRTFLQLLNADLGLRPANVVTLSVSLQGTKYRSGASQWQYYSEALERLRTVPGVESAGAVGYLPLSNNTYMAGAFKLDSGQSVPRIVMNAATPGYFQAIGTTLIAGRDFERAERGRGEPIVIVNEAFAQAAGLGTAVVGRRLKAPWSDAAYRIAGVVATNRLAGPAYPGGPQIFWPVQEEPPPTLTFVARVHGQAETLLAGCGQAIRAVDREVAVFDLKTLDQRLSEVLARPKFYTTATFFLACLAVLVAAIGTYGAAAYSVAQRKHEMGLRMALGASYPGIRALVVRESLVPVASGMLVGVIGAIATGRYLEHFVVSARPVDFWTCTIGAVLLLSGGFAAAWSATTQVLAIDPADALRAE